MGPTRTTPGVQKIKASLRQTKRLLAKDNLAADVRVETERRLKALEADLAQAEQDRRERNLATKYHKIKFFERQKVLRKLNQTKNKLASASGSEKVKLEAALLQHRVDLNYILNYPKTRKYIALFPPEVRKGRSAAPINDKTNAEREQVRNLIQEQMNNGTLFREPELNLESSKVKQESALPRKIPKSNVTDDVEEDDEFFENDDEDES